MNLWTTNRDVHVKSGVFDMDCEELCLLVLLIRCSQQQSDGESHKGFRGSRFKVMLTVFQSQISLNTLILLSACQYCRIKVQL